MQPAEIVIGVEERRAVAGIALVFFSVVLLAPYLYRLLQVESGAYAVGAYCDRPPLTDPRPSFVRPPRSMMSGSPL